MQLKNPAATALMAKMRTPPKDRVKLVLQILGLLASMRLDRQQTDLIAGFMDTYLALTHLGAGEGFSLTANSDCESHPYFHPSHGFRQTHG